MTLKLTVNFTPRLRPGSDLRDHKIGLFLSDEDKDRYNSLRPGDPSIVVTDKNTKTQWHVRRAPCGAPCYCAAEVWRA